MEKTTERPVQFEIAEQMEVQTRQAVRDRRTRRSPTGHVRSIEPASGQGQRAGLV